MSAIFNNLAYVTDSWHRQYSADLRTSSSPPSRCCSGRWPSTSRTCSSSHLSLIQGTDYSTIDPSIGKSGLLQWSEIACYKTTSCSGTAYRGDPERRGLLYRRDCTAQSWRCNIASCQRSGCVSEFDQTCFASFSPSSFLVLAWICHLSSLSNSSSLVLELLVNVQASDVLSSRKHLVNLVWKAVVILERHPQPSSKSSTKTNLSSKFPCLVAERMLIRNIELFLSIAVKDFIEGQVKSFPSTAYARSTPSCWRTNSKLISFCEECL